MLYKLNVIYFFHTLDYTVNSYEILILGPMWKDKLQLIFGVLEVTPLFECLLCTPKLIKCNFRPLREYKLAEKINKH